MKKFNQTILLFLLSLIVPFSSSALASELDELRPNQISDGAAVVTNAELEELRDNQIPVDATVVTDAELEELRDNQIPVDATVVTDAELTELKKKAKMSTETKK